MKLTSWAALGVLVCAAAFAGAPYYTAHQIKQAVKAGDAQALASQVDFQSVRASLKRQMGERLSRQLPDAVKSGAMADLGSLLAGRVADAALQAVVTPDGVVDLLSGRLPNPLNPGPASANAPSPDAPKASARYVGWDRFQIELPAHGQSVNLLLTRKGMLDWQLTDIELPSLL